MIGWELRGWPTRRLRDALREFVGVRDGWRCHYCGAPVGRRGRNRLTLDHVWPQSRGRVDAVWNLVAACEPCNSRRGSDLGWCDCVLCRVALLLAPLVAPPVPPCLPGWSM